MCDGIAEEILDALCTVSGLRVAARSSSFQFKSKSADVREMARTLGVSSLLEGSVRKIGDHLRVSARLVDASGYELWADKFDRPVSDAFAIQDEIARSVVNALRLRIGPEASRQGTTNAQAWEMYLRGRQYLRSIAENQQPARQLFRAAIDADPKFAQAYAGLADADALILDWRLAPKSTFPELQAEALASSEHALKLEPRLPEAHTSRASALAFLGRDEEADAEFRRAAELGPGVADTFSQYGRFLVARQRYPDAARAWEEAIRLNPDDYASSALVAMAYRRMKQPGKVDESNRRTVEIADRVLRTKPDDVRARYLQGGAMVALGRKEEGLRRIDEAVAMRPTDFAVLYNAACSFANAGETQKALDTLDRAVGTGQGFRAWFESDPDLDPLRSSPRYKDILARLSQ
jgi:adenylate cyclase